MSAKAPPRYGVEAHTVDEQMRINFTRQLLKLRDDTVTEVVFPSSLTNIERKFLHTLSEELGLKSKSSGGGADRRITVTKPGENGDAKSSGLAKIHFNSRSQEILEYYFSRNPALPHFDSQSLVQSDRNTEAWAKPSTAAAEADMIESAYRKAQAERDRKPSYASMQQKRASLPAFHHRQAVCTIVKEQQIVLVSGETGCGKTTQVPQFLLDDPDIGPRCRIVVTQPRRLSAISVAERIAAERGEKIGGTIGYNIRLEAEKSRSTQVLFVTPGVLLRKLQSDSALDEYTHIIIDEAHERDRFTEFLMIVLKFVCTQRKDLKLILMSATMQTSKLSAYFGGVPQIHMGGSVFPVQEFFLEHALRFTDYMANQPAVGGGGSGGKNDSALATYLRKSLEYSCNYCGGGPFKSPEELGTHCALCTGTMEVAATVSGSNYSRNTRHSSAEELVRMLAAAVTSAEMDRQKGSSSNKRFSASAALQGVRPHITAAPAAKDSRQRVRGGRGGKSAGAEQGDDVVPNGDDAREEITDANGDEDGDEEDEEEGEEGDGIQGDDEDEEAEGMSSAKAVSSVEVNNEGANTADDTGDVSDSLLRQYQYSFDDSQVDYDLILALLRYVFNSEFCKEGSVLVFMPGWDDISRMHRILSTTPEFGNSNKYKLIQLHSGIPRKTQNQVFEPLGPGEHKIILSTNIAETSITIDDVAVVIDSGRVKEKVYDPHVKLAYLKSAWISQASARQRKGRAGRTRAGVCFHLFSKRRHTSLPEFQDSELLRMPLEELVLQAKQLGLAPGHGDAPDSVQAFLQRAMDPPHSLSISNAISLLQAINCLDEREQVTPIGRAVSRLPLDPRIGRIVLLACICGCGPAVLSTSAAMAYRDPFVMPTSEQQRAISNAAKSHLAQGFPSDQVALLKALDGFNMMFQRFNFARASQYCDENFLSRSTMTYLRDLIQQLTQTLKDSGISPGLAFAQRNNGNILLLMALIGIGLYPDVGVRQQGVTAFFTEKGRKAKIHNSSVNSRSAAFKGPCREVIEIIGYQDLVSSAVSNGPPGAANLSMLNTTPVSVFALLLTCGSIKEVELEPGDDGEEGDVEVQVEAGREAASASAKEQYIAIEVDGWLRLRLTKETLTLVKSSRNVIEVAMEYFLSASDSALPQVVAKGVDAIVQALTLEQPSTAGLIQVPHSTGSAHSGTSSGGGGGGGAYRHGRGSGGSGAGGGRSGSSTGRGSGRSGTRS